MLKNRFRSELRYLSTGFSNKIRTRQPARRTGRQRHRGTEAQRDRGRHRDRGRLRDRCTEAERQRQRDKETEGQIVDTEQERK